MEERLRSREDTNEVWDDRGRLMSGERIDNQQSRTVQNIAPMVISPVAGPLLSG
jgi:hypothetical protein